MDYKKIITDVLDYIEDHLEDKIDSKELADYAGFSVSHFLWIFQVYTSYPLMLYIRRRRLSIALKRLKSGKHTVTQIGYDLCFESQDVFGRAFKRTYGITPYEYRTGNYLLDEFNRIEFVENEEVKNSMTAEIMTIKPMYLIGVEQRIHSNSDSVGSVWDSYFTNWDQMFGGVTNRVNPEDDVEYAISRNCDEEGYSYFVGFQVADLKKIPEGAVAITVNKMKCAKFTAKGEIPKSVGTTLERIYKEWLPSVDFEIASCSISSIERYDKRSIPGDHELEMEIFVPIEPAKPQVRNITELPSFEAVSCRITGDRNKCSSIKKKAFHTLMQWLKKNGVDMSKLSIYDMNSFDGDFYWYEVFYPLKEEQMELKQKVSAGDGPIQIKEYKGGLCMIQTTLHKMLEPTARTMESWCKESDRYEQVYRLWYEEYVIEEEKITLDTMIRLHMWVKEK